MIAESSDGSTLARVRGVTRFLTADERAGLKGIVAGSVLDEDEMMVVALSLCHKRVSLSTELIREARGIFGRKPMTRCNTIMKLNRSFREGDRLHDFAVLAERRLNDFCKRHFGEAIFGTEWIQELGGKPGQRLESGVPDIVTATHVYEVKDISEWKQSLSRAAIYASVLGLKPGLALFGTELEASDMEVLRRAASDAGVDLRLKVWKKDESPIVMPGQMTEEEPSSLREFLNIIRESELRKKEITQEMNYIVQAFSLSGPRSKAIGCLRLEETHCTKGGKKYGPYGPYYYLYLHRTAKLEKRYLGKRADKFRVRRDAIVKLRRLEAEYKRILKLERQTLSGKMS